MRVTGGQFRGRTLVAPAGRGTRPTTDRVRQALFNVLLHNEWEGVDPIGNAVVLDAFAGTGALGIEALSHGAAHAFFFEKDRAALAALDTNVKALDLRGRTTVFPRDVRRAGHAVRPASFVFFDPPYRMGLIEDAFALLDQNGWIAPRALLVCETARDEAITLPASCKALFRRAYGDTDVTAMRHQAGARPSFSART